MPTWPSLAIDGAAIVALLFHVARSSRMIMTFLPPDTRAMGWTSLIRPAAVRRCEMVVDDCGRRCPGGATLHRTAHMDGRHCMRRVVVTAKLRHVAIVSHQVSLLSRFYQTLFGMTTSGAERPAQTASVVTDGYIGMNINGRANGRQGG